MAQPHSWAWDASKTMVFRLQSTSQSPAGFVKTQIVGPAPRISDLVCLGWGPVIYISNKFLGNVSTPSGAHTDRGCVGRKKLFLWPQTQQIDLKTQNRAACSSFQTCPGPSKVGDIVFQNAHFWRQLNVREKGSCLSCWITVKEFWIWAWNQRWTHKSSGKYRSQMEAHGKNLGEDGK